MITIKEHIKKVQRKEIDIVEKTHRVIDEIKKINDEYHYFNVISEDLALEQAKKIKKDPKGRLSGLFVSVKDSIVVKDVESRGGSKVLDGYKPPFNSTAVQRVIDEGAIIIGKTSQDEFGFGGFAINTGIGFKKPLNPFDKERATGGSSGGCGGISEKASFPHVSLGESTGGSIVNPASFCGVYGLCPTYGRVSRYGLLDYGNSLDKVGPMGKDLYGLALVQKVISGVDEKDPTTLKEDVDDYESYLSKDVKGMNFGIIKEAFSDGLDKGVEKNVWNAIKKLESNGATYKEVSLPKSIKYGISTYYLIATSEASTNLAKYCGMRYGKEEELSGSFNEYFSKVREKNFGEEAKRRIMLGTFARMSGQRDAYYIKALKVRTKIIEEYKEAFKRFDSIVSPTVPILPPRFDELSKLTPLQHYMIDVMTVSPNLAGLPHMNIPIGFENNLPVGLMVTSDHLNEGKLFQISKEFSR